MAKLRVEIYLGDAQSMATLVELAEERGEKVLERRSNYIVVEKDIDVKPLPGNPYGVKKKKNPGKFKWRNN